MNKFSFIAACLLVAAATSCQQSGTPAGNPAAPTARKAGPAPAEFIIPADSANRMINSYLSSLDTAAGDSNLHSLIVDAGALRTYLNSESGLTVTSVKIMFAHRLSYINDGHWGVPCGYNNKGLTVVLCGYDADNNYIFPGTSGVMNHARPCPQDCPSYGTASRDTFDQ